MDEKDVFIFSVITSTYKQAQFIGEAIESVITQEGDFYIDYIIQDAKSPDNTLEVIKKYEQLINESTTVEERFGLTFHIPKDNSIVKCKGISYRWVSEKDNGTVDGINRGIAKSIGNVFVFLHSDDVFDNFAFANVMNGYLNNPEATVIYGNALEINEDSSPKSVFPIMNPAENLPKSGSLSQPSTFVKMDVIKKLGGLNEKIHNSFDYELWARLDTKGYKFAFINAVLSRTRIHGQTKTTLNRIPIFIESFAVAKNYYGDVDYFWKFSTAHERTFVARGTFVLQTILAKIRNRWLKLYSKTWYKLQGFDKKVDEKIKELFT